MIYGLRSILERIACMSECNDKKVGALAVLNDTPIKASWNIKDPNCKGDCNHNCYPMHAEHALDPPPGSDVYITVYPCEQCQIYLYNKGVKHVYVFNVKHKKDLGLIPITVLE